MVMNARAKEKRPGQAQDDDAGGYQRAMRKEVRSALPGRSEADLLVVVPVG
jgi:hypothetical protein